MLVRFNDRVFLQEGQWFLWDTSLGLFRPIDNYAWDGTKYVVDDIAYRKDPLLKTYCFGSGRMLAKCVKLSKKYESEIDKAPVPTFLSIGTPEWFRDRPVNFTHAATKDAASWKRLVNGNRRTCKQRSSKRFTKRTI
jgi:hypothetical protein